MNCVQGPGNGLGRFSSVLLFVETKLQRKPGYEGRGPPLGKQWMKKRQCQEPAGADAIIDAVPLPL